MGLKLVSLKNGVVVTDNLVVAKKWHERAKGLLGEQIAKPLYFKTRFGIHTFGLKFPIDVVVCDSEFTVRQVFRAVNPGRVILWNPRWADIFELPAGMAERANIATGDRLRMGGLIKRPI